MFIFHFADDLFQCIFNSHHTCDAAVFINNYRYMLPFSLHIVEQVVNRLGFRYEHWAAGYSIDGTAAG